MATCPCLYLGPSASSSSDAEGHRCILDDVAVIQCQFATHAVVNASTQVVESAEVARVGVSTGLWSYDHPDLSRGPAGDDGRGCRSRFSEHCMNTTQRVVARVRLFRPFEYEWAVNIVHRMMTASRGPRSLTAPVLVLRPSSDCDRYRGGPSCGRVSRPDAARMRRGLVMRTTMRMARVMLRALGVVSPRRSRSRMLRDRFLRRVVVRRPQVLGGLATLVAVMSFSTI